ncbi:MlaD family protein [Methylocella silvestris]|uniref:Mammalian cell entry protein n=1 Tax=Methylocella silvestris TaxID=199596 RepID=A0A2J7THV8_METSI|nr:MlaD family protein [Methylocella silvestris]PNG26360.1 mammalian cell entry protein [Methylocella silvestris]
METRANYALIGGFTLAVVAAAFAFVLWFSGGEKAGGQHVYRVVFTGSVSGLLRGAAVLFNGVRVGGVTKIDFVPDSPGKVYALIEIDARVPIRVDTKARLETTGLTGVANVALSGGSEDAKTLEPGPDGAPPTIIAERSDFQDLIESARKIAGQATEFLDRTNKVLDENSGSITASVKNIEKFSDALAANSDGLKDFLGSMADVGRAIKPLTAKLETLADGANNVIKAVDPAQVKTIVTDFAQMSGKLNAAADKVDSVLTNLNGFLATGDNKGVFEEIAAAARSIRKLADDVNARWKDIGGNLARFSGSGLRQYEALATDGRKTLDLLNQAIRSIEQNPQQFIFGRKQQIPEYSGAR